MEKKVINIGNKSYTLLVNQFDEDIEIEDLLKIDLSNLIGEIVTFPVIVNRFGMMVADAESYIAEAKLNLEIQESKIKERIRDEWEGAKAPTIDQLNNLLIEDKNYQKFKRAHIEAIKTKDYLNSVFWSLKDKSAKLDKLSMGINPGDISDGVLEGKINNIKIKQSKNLIN